MSTGAKGVKEAKKPIQVPEHNRCQLCGRPRHPAASSASAVSASAPLPSRVRFQASSSPPGRTFKKFFFFFLKKVILRSFLRPGFACKTISANANAKAKYISAGSFGMKDRKRRGMKENE